MSDAVIVALVTAVASVLGTYLANYAVQRKKSQEEAVKDAERETKQHDRLDSIERKLDEHNGYAKMFAEVKTSIVAIDKAQALMQKDIEYLKKSKS